MTPHEKSILETLTISIMDAIRDAALELADTEAARIVVASLVGVIKALDYHAPGLKTLIVEKLEDEPIVEMLEDRPN